MGSFLGRSDHGGTRLGCKRLRPFPTLLFVKRWSGEKLDKGSRSSGVLCAAPILAEETVAFSFSSGSGPTNNYAADGRDLAKLVHAYS
jgi:hypothetical protein